MARKHKQKNSSWGAWLSLVGLLLLFASSCHEILSTDITDLSLSINSPADSLYTNDQTISFWWEADTEIEQFQLRLTRGNSGNIDLLVDTVMVANSIAYTFDEEGIYNWQVRGVNAASETAWQAYTFVIDLSNPDKATALNFQGDTLGSGMSDSLRWSSLDLSLDGLRFPTTDSLRVFRKNDSATIGERFFFEEDEPRSFSFSANNPLPFNGPGTYYWQIVSFDRAGNQNLSNQFKFTVE